MTTAAAGTGPVVTATPISGGVFRPGVVVDPGMCGPTSLFGGRVGDWTWATVAEATGCDVFRARTPAGAPAYLSFHYLRIRTLGWQDYTALEFGDRLDVTSRCFGLGSESVHTVHRLAPAGTGPIDLAPDCLDAAAVPCLQAETFNRWISRERAGDNTSLSASGPADFRFENLCGLDDAHSPRREFARARRTGSFRSGGERLGTPHRTEFEVSLGRDLNGAGLCYFASFLAYCDNAVADLWVTSGGTAAGYLAREVSDVQVCFLGNANAGTRLCATAIWATEGHPDEEMAAVDVSVVDGDRQLAIATYRVRVPREDT